MCLCLCPYKINLETLSIHGDFETETGRTRSLLCALALLTFSPQIVDCNDISLFVTAQRILPCWIWAAAAGCVFSGDAEHRRSFYQHEFSGFELWEWTKMGCSQRHHTKNSIVFSALTPALHFRSELTIHPALCIIKMQLTHGVIHVCKAFKRFASSTCILLHQGLTERIDYTQ